MKPIRLVERKKGSKWLIIRMEEVRKGDTFRLTEPDGTPVKVGRKRNFIALGDAFKDPNLGTWAVEADA